MYLSCEIPVASLILQDYPFKLDTSIMPCVSASTSCLFFAPLLLVAFIFGLVGRETPWCSYKQSKPINHTVYIVLYTILYTYSNILPRVGPVNIILNNRSKVPPPQFFSLLV